MGWLASLDGGILWCQGKDAEVISLHVDRSAHTALPVGIHDGAWTHECKKGAELSRESADLSAARSGVPSDPR